MIPTERPPGMPRSPFDLFQWLTPEARCAVADAARTIRLPARGTIYTQSEPGQEMYRIVHGTVRLSVMQKDGRELLYQLFEPGDCFGTSSLVDGEPRPQTAEARDAVTLQVFDRDSMRRLRSAHPSVNDALLRLLSRHMRLLSDYFAGSMFDELACRLAQRLVDTVGSFGIAVEGGLMLSTPLSQSELALMVGTSRQSVNRTLHDFRQAGLIETANGRLMITDLDRLRRMAEQGWRLRRFVA
jgi:CRP-like cAMP-binding protein